MDFSFSKRIQLFITLYTYLASGYILYSRQLKVSLLSLLLILAIGYALIMACFFCTKFFNRYNSVKMIPYVIYILSLGVSSATLFYLFSTLIAPEKNYNDISFALIFIPLILSACFYCARHGYISCSRACLILVPIIIFTMIISLLAFTGNSKGVSLVPSFAIPQSDFEPLVALIFFDTLLFFFTASHSEAKSDISVRSVSLAYAAFGLTAILENIKHTTFFGKEGILYIENPIKTILSAVPFADMQEMYSVIFLIAFIIKISIYLASSTDALKSVMKRKSELRLFVACCIPCYLIFAFLCILSRSLH